MKKINAVLALFLFFCFTMQSSATENRISSSCSVQVMSWNVSCYGQSNGIAWAVTSGGVAPYTYSWSGTTAITDTVTGLAAGTYTVTVTDGNSCVSSGTVTILQPTLLGLAVGPPMTVNCFGQCTGQVMASAAGGTP